MKLQSGHEIIPLEEAERERHRKHFKGNKHGFLILEPGRWMLHAKYKDFADKITNFKWKSSDVVVMTYPKCGTTWTQEIVWTMRNNPNLDHPDANLHVMVRSPFLDADMLSPTANPESPSPKSSIHEAFEKNCPGKDPKEGMWLQLAEVIPDPRTIKTHLPFSLMAPSLLDTCKVIYVARNPKDVIVSFHHHVRILKGQDFDGTFEDFVQHFVDDDIFYGPYWLHLKEAWERRNHLNLHFIFYEDLKAEPLDELRRLDTFLGTNLTEEQLLNIVKYTSFSEMKERDKAHGKSNFEKSEIVEKEGGFYRKGEAGDWKNKLTPDLDMKVDHWIQKNFTSFGVKFKYGV